MGQSGEIQINVTRIFKYTKSCHDENRFDRFYVTPGKQRLRKLSKEADFLGVRANKLNNEESVSTKLKYPHTEANIKEESRTRLTKLEDFESITCT